MCFTLGWFQDLFIWLIVIVAIIAIIKLLLPYILGPLGGDGAVINGVVRIVLWAIIACLVVYLAFALLSCVGHGMPLFQHR